MLRRAMQFDPFRFLSFQPCRGRTLLFSSRSIPLLQEPFSLLLFGTLALPSIPHWFKFAVVCIPKTGILLLFGHDFGIFIPVACVISMRKHLFCPQKPHLGVKNAFSCKFCPLKVRFGALLSSSKTGEESLFGLSMHEKGCFIGVFHSYVTTKSAQSSFLDIKFCQNNKETVFSSCFTAFYVA